VENNEDFGQLFDRLVNEDYSDLAIGEMIEAKLGEDALEFLVALARNSRRKQQ
jgi:hypothetical protein